MADEGKPGGQGDTKPAGEKPAAETKPAVPDASVKPAAEGAAKPDDKPAEKPTGDGVKPGDKPGEQAAPVVPDKYTLTLPKGSESYLDADDLKRAEVFAREAKLTNEQAQAMIDEQATGITAMEAAFRTLTTADPKFGGDQLKETERLATLFLDKFAPKGDEYGDELRRDLVRSGYGSKRGVVVMMARAGKAMAEDTPGVGSGGGGGPADDAGSKLYDHPTSKAIDGKA